MIAVIALNPAIDVTHHVHGVDWAGVNRPASVRAVPGGKGVNVARTLHALGADVLLLAMVGGPTGDEVRQALDAGGLPAIFTEIAATTRRTFAVVDTKRNDVGLFNEPGPSVTAAEYARFLASYDQALRGCDAVVLSGSLPAGLPAGCYAGLIRTASAAGVASILDSSGDALRDGAAAGPALVKPNHDELAAAVGRFAPWRGLADLPSVVAAAHELRAQGPAAVVVSLGAAGLLAVTEQGSWLAAAEPVTGNPTGAGDAVVAALAHGQVLGRSWPERLRHAAALGSAAVAAATGGEFCHADYRQALEGVRVTDAGQP
jgi:tagatose 6-phosphate kinase